MVRDPAPATRPALALPRRPPGSGGAGRHARRLTRRPQRRQHGLDEVDGQLQRQHRDGRPDARTTATSEGLLGVRSEFSRDTR